MPNRDPHQPNPGDTLLFENERVRVWSMTVEPGSHGDYHSHQHDHVLIWPVEGRSMGQLLGQEAPTRVQNARPGFVAFKTVGREHGLHPHRLHNLEGYATTHYIVELLDASPSPGEQNYEFNDRGEMYDQAAGDAGQ